jgi:hypothetical protein
MIAFLVDPVALEEVFEEERGGETGGLREGVGGGDLEEGEGEGGFALFSFECLFG